MAYVAKVTAGGNTGMLIGSTLYGACSTAAATVDKVVTITGFDTLITGVTIHVKFTYSNTASSPTLNVTSTGAKAIKMYGTTAVGGGASLSWPAGAVVSLTYDGTNWVMNDFSGYDLNASRLTAGTVPAARLPTGSCLIDATSSSHAVNNTNAFSIVSLFGVTDVSQVKLAIIWMQVKTRIAYWFSNAPTNYISSPWTIVPGASEALPTIQAEYSSTTGYTLNVKFSSVSTSFSINYTVLLFYHP